jgi:Lipocalin-like domain
MRGAGITFAMLLLAMGLSMGETRAQVSKDGAKDLVGTWVLVSATVDHDGTKSEPFGPHPNGLLMFDRGGHFSLVAVRPDLPGIASNNRTSGTAEENRRIVRGTIAYFGTYTVSEADRMFTLHVEGATFPNWVGTDQKRIYTINGDQLRYTNPNRSGGQGTALVIWKRAN